MFPRRMRLILCCALLLGAGTTTGGGSAAHAAQGFTVYTNHELGYTINYPAGWRRLPSKLLNLLVRAPDTLGVLGATAASLSTAFPPSTTEIQSIVDSNIYSMGAPKTAKIHHFTRLIKGVTFQEGETIVTAANGDGHHDMVLSTYQYSRLYVFVGLVVLGNKAANLHSPNAVLETSLIQQSFNSITLMK